MLDIEHRAVNKRGKVLDPKLDGDNSRKESSEGEGQGFSIKVISNQSPEHEGGSSAAIWKQGIPGAVNKLRICPSGRALLA